MNSSLTQLISIWNDGEHWALDELIVLSYTRLHRSARFALGMPSPGQSMQATELVNELYCHFKRQSGMQCNNSAEFFAIAAFKLRQILQERYRMKAAQKRNHPGIPSPCEIESTVTSDCLFESLVVSQLIDRIREIDEKAAAVVELRTFWKFNTQEIADILGISVRTGNRLWNWSKAWILENRGEK